jgi:hypothetical protein
MRNNITALQHPTIKRKIRRAIWLAKLAAHAEARGLPEPADYRRHTKQHYVTNRKGKNILRVDYNYITGLTVWGDQSRNITSMVKAALYE